MKSAAALVAAISILGSCTQEARAASSVILPKPGQIGLEVGGGYGGFLQSGNMGQTFGLGPEFVVRIRYRMRYERGVGLSFESQQLDVRQEPPPFTGPDSTIKPVKLSVILSGVEFYQMFGTRTISTRMVMIGAGIAQTRAELNDGETELTGENSGDGVYVNVGAGVERFVYRSWALDFSGRYFAVFKDGQANHDIQVAVGAIFYASY
jgi:opacity protein-like surface antigen